MREREEQMREQQMRAREQREVRREVPRLVPLHELGALKRTLASARGVEVQPGRVGDGTPRRGTEGPRTDSEGGDGGDGGDAGTAVVSFASAGAAVASVRFGSFAASLVTPAASFGVSFLSLSGARAPGVTRDRLAPSSRLRAFSASSSSLPAKNLASASRPASRRRSANARAAFERSSSIARRRACSAARTGGASVSKGPKGPGGWFDRRGSFSFSFSFLSGRPNASRDFAGLLLLFIPSKPPLVVGGEGRSSSPADGAAAEEEKDAR